MHFIMIMICCIISRMFSFEILERIQNETKAQSFGWSMPHTRRVTPILCDDPACRLPPRFLSDSVLFPQPLILYPAFQFLLPPYYLHSSCLWPQLPPGNSSSGVNRGLEPSLHTRVWVAQLYCERPTHTEFRYIEAHSSRCQWCFCGKLAMSPLYSGFPLINQPSGKPSLSVSTSLVLSLPWMEEGCWEKEGERLLGLYLVFLTWSDTLMLCCEVV